MVTASAYADTIAKKRVGVRKISFQIYFKSQTLTIADKKVYYVNSP